MANVLKPPPRADGPVSDHPDDARARAAEAERRARIAEAAKLFMSQNAELLHRLSK